MLKELIRYSPHTYDKQIAMKLYRSTTWIRKSALLFMGLLFTGIASFAQPDWSVNPGDYSDFTEVNAVIFVGGTFDSTGTLGAFINGECRGVVTDGTYWSALDTNIFTVNVYSDIGSGETVHFMFYEDASGITYAINETVISDQQNTQGDLIDPLDFTTYLDTEAPTVTSCPSEISVNNDATICGAVVS